MNPKGKAPSTSDVSFNCPHCGAFSAQNWSQGCVSAYRHNTPEVIPVSLQRDGRLNSNKSFLMRNLSLSQCESCKAWAVWVRDSLIYPKPKFETLPNQDLPPDLIAIFDEARSIVDLSPKGAAALLRLAIQKLCKELGESGKDINNDIGSLVTKGLLPQVQQSLDAVRVIGNEAVHPGTIDWDDDKDIAYILFDLVNLIAEQMITQPKQAKEIYSKLPPNKLKGIEDRDKNNG